MSDMTPLPAREDKSYYIQPLGTAVVRKAAYDELYRTAEKISAERTNWMDTAGVALNGQRYYINLLVRIAKVIGAEAYRDDTGKRHDEVVSARLPYLVENHISELRKRHIENAQARNEGDALRAENKKLRAENETFRFEFDRLRKENEALREAVARYKSAAQFIELDNDVLRSLLQPAPTPPPPPAPEPEAPLPPPGFEWTLASARPDYWKCKPSDYALLETYPVSDGFVGWSVNGAHGRADTLDGAKCAAERWYLHVQSITKDGRE